MKKKIFAIALALCMVLTMMPSMAFAEEEEEDEGTKFVNLSAYEILDGDSEPLNEIVELEEFYVIADYEDKGEKFCFYSENEGEGIFIAEQGRNDDNKAYAKVSVNGYFYEQTIRITFWIGEGSEEQEAGNISLTVNKKYVPADKSLIVCTSPDEGKTFEPIPVRVDPSKGAESPAQYMMPNDEDGVFYVLCQDNGDKRIKLPSLDGFRNPTGKVAKNIEDVKLTETTTITYDKEYTYNVWKVTIPKDWSGAERVGFSFFEDDKNQTTVAKYSLDGKTQQTKFMWILGNDYCETPSEGIWGDVIPCETQSEGQYNGYGELNSLTKQINLSLPSDAEENTFYVLHPENTELTQSSYQQFRYEIDGYGMGGDPLGGNFSKKLDAIYNIEQVTGKTIEITKGNDTKMTLWVSKVTLKNDSYYGYQDILSTFAIKGSDVGQATIRLTKGMDITLQGDTEGVKYFNPNVEFSQEIMGITPDSALSFTKHENGSTAFYQNACAEVNEEGQGSFVEMNLELKPGYVLEAVTNGESEIAYVGLRCQYYTLLDKSGNAIMGNDFWTAIEEYNVGAAANENEHGEEITYIQTSHCFASVTQNYRKSFLHGELGKGNVDELLKLLQKEAGYRVEPGVSFTSFALYFDPAKGDGETKLIFHIKKADASGDEISITGNGKDNITATIDEDEIAATKDLLKKNLTTIGTDGYEILDVYDITANEADVKGLYNITIPALKLKNANPEECKVVYYADGSAVPLEMETTYTTGADGKANGIVFTTGHFSNYAVLYKSKTSPQPSGGGAGGGGAGIKPPETNDNPAQTEEPTDAAAAKIEKAKSIVSDMKLIARSSKTAKKNIKVVLKDDPGTKAAVKELEELGFTVKYRFYRSTTKTASYKAAITKESAFYTNTIGKRGTKYFYKVQIRVYDENDNLIAKTALGQCKYAVRVK